MRISYYFDKLKDRFFSAVRSCFCGKMARHEGVSCDSCLKAGFRGRRYKCLICYDYDLCSTCYEAGATTTRHTADHPVQCILTRTDFDIFYGGEALTAEQPQTFSCPYCGKMGFSEVSLQEHVISDHVDSSNEVVCPICAAMPGGDPNHVTDDFACHLTLEHRTPREFDEPIGIRHVRRIPHRGRGVGGTRIRHANMHFSSGGSNLTGLSPSGGRENMDPIAELLSQLSSVRNRAAAAQSVSSQLQQLEMQLQSTSFLSNELSVELENERGRRLLIKRQQLEKLPKRQQAELGKASITVNTTSNDSGNEVHKGTAGNTSNNSNSQFLLSRCVDSLSEAEKNIEQEKLHHSVFVQELLLSTLTEQLQTESTEKSNILETGDSQMEARSPNFSEENESLCRDISDPIPSNNPLSIPKQKKVKKLQSLQKLVQAGSTNASEFGGRQNTIQGSNVKPVQGASSMVYAVQHMGGLSSLSSMGGAGPNMGSHHGRRLSAGRERDRETRVPPPQAKRNMLKHMPATKASDREPPPY